MDYSDSPGSWLKHLPTQRKMMLVFGALLLVLLTGSFTFLRATVETADARAWVRHTREVLENLDELLMSAVDQETGVRGYIVTGDEHFLEPYNAGIDHFSKAFSAVQTLTHDNAGQQARLVQVDSVMRDWQKNIAEKEISWIKTSGSNDKAVELVASQEGKKRMDRLRQIVSDMREAEQELLIEREKTTVASEHNGELLTYALMLIGTLISLLALNMTRKLVTQPLMNIAGLMTRLSNHDHDIEIPDRGRRDEIGSLAKALGVFKTMAIEIRDQSWVKTQVSDISVKLQSCKSHRNFAETLCSEISPRVGASIAAFHQMMDDGDLSFIAGYAYQEQQKSNRMQKSKGDLVSQCAHEKKSILVSELPEGYFRVTSGLGDAAPRYLLLVPVLSGQSIRGVIELGSFSSFSELQQRFLEALLPMLALTLENISRAVKTQALLEETQAQAEELAASEESLRVQQEELRVTNEQLEQHGKSLRASEEELRVQAEELRIANDQMQEKNEALNQQKKRLEQLQEETQTKADELAQASRYKSEFLANMSHELRTPLNSMLILSKSLADNEGGNLNADQQEAARIVNEGGNTLLHLINDILDLSKVEAGKMEVYTEAIDLKAFAATVERNFKHVAKERGIEFNVTVSRDVPETIEQDVAKIHQVVANLLANAFKFTAKGSVQLVIRNLIGDEFIQGATPDGFIAFSVRDTGIGIPADKVKKVFEAFKQVDGTTSRKYGGTGLGLSISMNFAQLLGGDIQLQSVEGKGSEFTLLLPRSTGKSTPVRQRQVAAAPPEVQHIPQPILERSPEIIAAPPLSDKPLILIIEDDPNFAKILAESTRKRGCEVVVAQDGESGYATAVAHVPTGIILDVALPGMDGWNVIEKLKQNPATRHIPVHFISAQDESHRGLGLGAVGYLVKPVSREAINQAFDKVLHFAKGSPRKLLLVDDDEGSRLAVQTLIDMPDVTVVEVHNGEQGLIKLREQDYDCIILDLGLPDMDGLEFLKRATRNGAIPPVVIYSAKCLSNEETMQLRQYTDSIVIKSARSPERLLDEVTLFLHSIRDVNATAARFERQGDSELTGKVALVVDDDMRNVFALSRALRSRGLNVVMAEDGHKALSQMEKNPLINIVLMDIMMPGMDGYATIREIRKQARWEKMPIIAVSAKAMQGDREKCIAVGANEYLAKPIDIDKLISMMRVLI